MGLARRDVRRGESMLERQRLARHGPASALLLALIFLVLSLISHLLLRRWHESAVRREN